MNTYTRQELINIGTGSDITIANLANLIAEVVGYKGDFIFDASKPDGTPRKMLDVGRLTKTGWHASTSLKDGITKTVSWCIEKNIFG